MKKTKDHSLRDLYTWCQTTSLQREAIPETGGASPACRACSVWAEHLQGQLKLPGRCCFILWVLALLLVVPITVLAMILVRLRLVVWCWWDLHHPDGVWLTARGLVW